MSTRKKAEHFFDERWDPETDWGSDDGGKRRMKCRAMFLDWIDSEGYKADESEWAKKYWDIIKGNM